MTDLCPHCGFNFRVDEPITLGPWALSLNGVSYNGSPCRLTPTEVAALYSVAKAAGEIVGREAILNRVSGSESVKLVDVYLCRLRKKLGHLYPLEHVWGKGVRWSPQAPGIREPAFLSSGPTTAAETPATHPSPCVAGGFGEVRTVSHRKTV